MKFAGEILARGTVSTKERAKEQAKVWWLLVAGGIVPNNSLG